MEDLRPTIKSLERQVEQAAQLLSEQGILPAGQVLGILRGWSAPWAGWPRPAPACRANDCFALKPSLG